MTWHRLTLFCVALIGSAAAATGCAATSGEDAGPAAEITAIDGIGERTVQVTTTTNIVTDMMREIGGDRVEVTGLMGPGIDPHLYKASAADVGKLRDADLIAYIGRDLEGRMADVLDEMASRQAAVAVANGIDEADLLNALEGMGNYQYDPHVWFDPDLWSDAAREAAAALQKIDPDHADVYQQNLDAYLAEIEELVAYAERELAAVPASSRVVVTSHDAFRYFGKRFAWDVAGIQGTSTATEATTGDIDRTAKLIADRQLRSIFVESSVPPQTINAVIDAADALGQTTQVGGELYSDSAGDEGTPEGTYIGMFRHNIDTLARGLS